MLTRNALAATKLSRILSQHQALWHLLPAEQLQPAKVPQCRDQLSLSDRTIGTAAPLGAVAGSWHQTVAAGHSEPGCIEGPAQ